LVCLIDEKYKKNRREILRDMMAGKKGITDKGIIEENDIEDGFETPKKVSKFEIFSAEKDTIKKVAEKKAQDKEERKAIFLQLQLSPEEEVEDKVFELVKDEELGIDPEIIKKQQEFKSKIKLFELNPKYLNLYLFISLFTLYRKELTAREKLYGLV